MQLSDTLDVALGLAIIYLLFAMVASRLNEYIANMLQWRAKGLSRGMTALVGLPAPAPFSKSRVAATGLARDFRKTTPLLPLVDSGGADPFLSAAKVKEHPLIKAFDTGLARNRRVSYIPSRTFARAVIDVVSGGTDASVESVIDDDKRQRIVTLLGKLDDTHLTGAGRSAAQAMRRDPTSDKADALARAIQQGDFDNLAILGQISSLIPTTLDQVRGNLNRLEREGNPAARALRSYLDSAGGDVEKLIDGLAGWFDDQMDRVTGTYKRQVQLFVASFAIAVSIVFNVDTIAIAHHLWTSPVERAALANAAVANSDKSLADLESEIDKLPGFELPIGWNFHPADTAGGDPSTDPRAAPHTASGWLQKVLGIGLSAFAISFGAPFWFDALGKLANVRNAGKKPEPS